MLTELASAAATLFVIIDPIGNLPLFISVTAGMTAAERRATAVQATIVATAILVVFAVFGQRVLSVMGVSIDAFRIAGGLLLFWTSFEMVFGDRQQRRDNTVQTVTADQVTHLAIVPLAIPLMAGPGSISATILLSSHLLAERPDGVLRLSLLIVIIVAIMAIGLAAFMMAGPINRIIGKTGASVLTRLLGVLLAALSVQFVIDGVVAVAGGGS